jgi:hypothetical protein
MQTPQTGRSPFHGKALLLAPIQRAVVDRFGDVGRFDVGGPFEVLDRARDLDDAVTTRCMKSQKANSVTDPTNLVPHFCRDYGRNDALTPVGDMSHVKGSQ